jgi:hypothetical protein
MAFTTADLTALETAMKSGTRVVRYQDKTVEYRSLDEMLQLYSFIKTQLDATDAPAGLQTTVGTKRILASFSKGLTSDENSDFDEN